MSHNYYHVVQRWPFLWRRWLYSGAGFAYGINLRI
jgi:hypothetical protein